MRTRICTACGTEYPATSEYFYADKSVKCDGLASKCKKCRNSQIREYEEKNQEEVTRRKREYDAKHREIKRAKSNLHYADNKEAIKIKNAERYAANKEKIDARNKAYRDANPEKERDRCKAYRSTDRGKFIGLRKTHRRDAIIKSLPITLTPEEWEKCKNYFSNQCAYCGRHKKLTIDHFVPANSGGEMSVHNTIPACISCNSSKSTKNFFSWYPSQPFYDKGRERKILEYLNYKGHTQQLALFK